MRPQPAWAPFAGALFVFLLWLPSDAMAQSCPLAPGCRAELQQTIPFSAADQSLWGPDGDESLLEGYTLTLFDESWNESDDDSDYQTFNGWWGNWKFGGSVSGSTSGRIASYFDVTQFGQAQVSIDYPVQVMVSVPQPNTFRPGDNVTIRTSWVLVEDDAELNADVWATDLALRGRFGMAHSADFEVCVVDCFGDDFFPSMSIPETGFDLFRTEGGSFGIGDEEVTDAASLLDFIASAFTGITAYIQAPEPFDGSSVDGTALEASGSDEWAVLDVDVDSFLRFIKVLPGFPHPPYGACLELEDYGAFDLCYETVDLDSQYRIIQDEDVSFDASVNVRVDFPVELGYHVADPSGTVTESDAATSVSFPVGHSLTIYTPTDVDPISLSPTFSLENTIERQADMRLKYWMTNRELQLSFDMAEVSASDSRRVDEGGYERDCPSFDSDPVGWAECWALSFADLPRRWLDWVSDWVTETVTKTANAIDFDVGPVYEVDFAETEDVIPLFDRSWELGGFADASGDGWLLDPEDPRISISSSIANSLASGGTAGQVVQTLTVSNDGDVPLDLTSFVQSLAGPGLAVDALTSGDVTVNAGFDGVSDVNILGSGVVDPGATGTVTLRGAPSRGRTTLAADVTGTSPIATDVTAGVEDSFGWYGSYALPKKLVRRGRGYVTLVLKGTDELDVDQIDLSTIRWEGATPRRVWRTPGRFFQARVYAVFKKNDVIAGMDARESGATGDVQSVTGVLDGAEVEIEFELASPGEVAEALFGFDRSLATDANQSYDRAGNQNGRLDLGDLRATLFPNQVVEMPDDIPAEALAEDLTDEEGLARWGNRWRKWQEQWVPHVTLTTGTLSDGTPFWAETTIKIFERN